ncbi:MAG: EAL domain-containing protein [Bacilli bacterium]|nr:EAL domain-containing protein [Bacilli bacterium]
MRKRTIKSSFALSLSIPAFVLALMLLFTVLFGLLYASSAEQGFLIALITLDVSLGLVFVGSLFYVTRYVHKVYYDGFYRVSKANMARLERGEEGFEYYPSERIAEMADLNDLVRRISEKWAVSVLYTKEADLDAIGIHFLDEGTRLLGEKELREHIPNLIQASQAFTVGLLDLHYEIGQEKLTIEEKKRLLATANEAFAFIPGRLFAFGEDEKSLLCYLPGIDSMRIIYEKVQGFTSDLSVSKRMADGMVFYPIKAAMVCYPHSSIGDMEDDLAYAKRQSAPITFFLPDRKKKSSSDLTIVDHQSSVAFFNKILLPLRHLSGVHRDEDKKTLQTVFDAVASFIGADFKFMALLDDTSGRFYPYFETGKKSQKPVSNELIESLIGILDEDDSFYFSTRESCSSAIARYVDGFGLRSGFIYALYDGNKCIGAFVYGRSDGDMVFDSYTKEALIRMGEAFTDYFFLADKEERARTFQRQSEHILGLSQYSVYKVDDSSMKLTYVSPNLRALFPNAEVGQPCHKALYGLERMCPHCPIKEYSKMNGDVQAKMGSRARNVEIETSLTLNDAKTHERALLVERIHNGERSDAYDRNWLSYSFATLVGQLENAYLIHSRGYLLLICLDNLENFITLQGSEGACFGVRCFIQEIKKALDTHDVYAYNPACIAILLPRIGHVEMIDICEKIYDLSKKKFFDTDKEDSFRLTYLPLGYPRGYTSAGDFLAHVEEFYRNGDFKRGEDFIFFHDHSISRSASKRAHMLAVIDEVFGTRAASCVYLQPIVLASDKKIFGAEVLLRVEDTQRHNFFRADEISRIAEENDRISLITESRLNFVGELYKEHGTSVFAINNFRRISINVDAAFLKDTELSKKVSALYTEQHLGKDFLSFEVPEDLIGEDFEAEGNAFAGSGALLVCDRYTGRYVSLAKLKRYGFREVKLPRELVNGIDVDAKKLAELTDIVNTAKSLEMKVSVVGVENEAQYLALKNLDETMLMQGYYFYKPVSRADLITAVVSHH